MGCRILILLVITCLSWTNLSVAGEKKLLVEVIDPYIEMHTGPGRGYPIFYVALRGELVEIKFRQTDWFKVVTINGKVGWVERDQMVLTLNPSGERLKIKDPGEREFAIRRWEYGVTLGDFEGATVMTASAIHHFTENIATEIFLSQAIGDASSSTLLGVGLIQQPFPEWKISPFFTLGLGIKNTRLKAILVSTTDRKDNFATVGFGVRMHFTKRFLLRAEFRKYVVFTSRDDNEEIDEWKAGFGFFF